MFRSRWAVTTVACVAVAALVSSCGSSESSAAAGQGAVDTNATLSVGWTQAVTTLDPHMATSDLASFRFGLNNIYDRLFTVDYEGKPDGMLVTDWTYNDDGSRLVLTLREDASFRDGTPLDAAVVKANLDRARTLESPVVKRSLSAISEVSATGPYEVTIALGKPTDQLPYLLAGVAGLIMNPPLFESGDPSTTADGSGAYSIESWAPGEKLVLVRDRDDYWDADAAKPARIEHTGIPDFQAFTNAVAGGQIDIGQFQPGNVAAVEGRDGLVTVPVEHGVGMEIAINRNAKPLEDLRVRQALNHALDRETITEALYPGSRVRWQFVPEGLAGFDESLEDIYPYDPEKAKALLAEAGYPNGIDLGEIAVSSATTPGMVDVVQEQFAAAGIRFEPRVLDGVEVYTQFASGRYPLLIGFSSAGISFAAGLNTRIGPTQNPAGTTPEYDTLIAEVTDSRRTEDERTASKVELNKYLTEEAWGVPVVWVTYPWVMSDKVGNFSTEMDYATTWGPYDLRYLTVTE
ncbi:peptide/nickel transport system substrate-binding protein [Rhodococcus rhodochrous J45]|uniref:Peptide/nickel transport system substrate-binding protein n=1 Tax=Rhodococcus rhodochrous J45 TaxID=935266 RepID=A0A562E8T6_RHORH|nr:peptide/nickel transport system substrate-binding protein [Rhodococcus rhodochrous J45]